MNDVIQEQIDEALANCPWLSQNRQGYTLIPDICTGACLPCAKVIERGQCDTLIELFYGKRDIIHKYCGDANNTSQNR